MWDGGVGWRGEIDVGGIRECLALGIVAYRFTQYIITSHLQPYHQITSYHVTKSYTM
jgi:hypothetical protein